MNTNIPNNPVMLLSYVNTQLRDFYDSLHDFCQDFQLDEAVLCSQLSSIDYEYDETLNQFI